MSHYITASFGEKNEDSVVLSYGVSWRTLSALRNSGIDIYELYDGHTHDAGMSGDGTTIEVSSEQGEYAYRHVVAWAVAMQECYPETYQKEYGGDAVAESDQLTDAQKINQIIDNQPFPLPDIEPLAQQLYDDLYQYPLNEDQINRSMGYLYLF
ncbi:MAG: hypothetical protein R8G66_21075 [Cytophagales bacterium]|nr:hypothetical protein [Cytophagales bacterium]